MKNIFESNLDIQKVFCINLKKRNDRKTQAIKEYEKIKTFLSSNLIFFDAIEDPIGWKGCFRSHLEVLKFANKNNIENTGITLIFEDDFEIFDTELFSKSLFFIKNNDFDLFNFGVNPHSSNFKYKYHYGDFVRIFGGYSAHCIAISENFLETLINKLEERYLQFPVDEIYNLLARENNFFSTRVPSVIQRPSFSDIEKKNVKYNHVNWWKMVENSRIRDK